LFVIRVVPFDAALLDESLVTEMLNVVLHPGAVAFVTEPSEEAQGWGPWSVKDGIIYAHAPADALSQVLALRVHLDDSTEQNGPLRVLPATHTLGVLTDDEIHQLSTQVSAVNCLVQRGGVVAIKPLIVHGSSKSQSENSRRVLHIEYAASEFTAGGLHLAVA
jgi:Phytanoyl-CoA dioxygenase (PhyH)